MSYLVIARKWRPQSFDELVGQEHVSQALQNALRGDRVAHAFLFTGVRGVGKTTAARILAKALNCETGPTPTPCNVCTNCREITSGQSVDVLEIDGASNTGVDDVREIIENVRYRPAHSRFRLYIIDEVHMLSTSAFNALLKTLEEPPSHVKFIFATTDPHKVPATIHSRCQRYDFKRIPLRAVADRLGLIARAEEIEISDSALFRIAREGEGSMRDAQSLFDQVIAFAGRTVRDEDVPTALGLADRRLLLEAGRALAAQEAPAALAALREAHGFGYDLRRFARDLLEHFRNLALAGRLGDGPWLADLPDEERAEVLSQTTLRSGEDFDRAFRILQEADLDVGRVPYPLLLLEMALLRVATMAPVVPVEALLERLAQLEKQLRSGAPAGRPSPSPRTDAPSPPMRREEPGRAASVAAARPSVPNSPPETRRPPAPPARGKPSPEAATAVRPPRKEPAPAPSPSAPTPAAGPSKAADGAPRASAWRDFVSFVTKERFLLVPYLQAVRTPSLEGPEIRLQVPAGHFHDYLAEPAHLRELEALLGQFLDRSVRVVVEPMAADPSVAPAAPPSTAELRRVAMENSTVQVAMEVLGGEIQDVRSRAPQRGKDGEKT